jgi:hypothetical protein
MNKKSQIMRERKNSEERKEERASGITKEVAGEQKSMEKQWQQKTQQTVSSWPPPLQMGNRN